MRTVDIFIRPTRINQNVPDANIKYVMIVVNQQVSSMKRIEMAPVPASLAHLNMMTHPILTENMDKIRNCRRYATKS